MLDRLDLTELVVSRVDLDRVARGLDVEAVLDRLDLTELVVSRVDLDRVARGLDVEAVLDRLDLTELVVSRVDLDRVARGLDIEAVLDRLDLTELVVSRVDLDRVARGLDIEAIAYRLDLTALAERIDLIRLAEEVVVGIDLPPLIRDSTGSVASEGIAGVRMQGMEADQAVAHFVDRVLRRRPRRPPAGAGTGRAPTGGRRRRRSGRSDAVSAVSGPSRDPAAGMVDRRVSAIPPAARELQGRRAGLVTRLLANTVDFGVVVGIVAGGYAAVAALRFLWNSRAFTFPAPASASSCSPAAW